MFVGPREASVSVGISETSVQYASGVRLEFEPGMSKINPSIGSLPWLRVMGVISSPKSENDWFGSIMFGIRFAMKDF